MCTVWTFPNLFICIIYIYTYIYIYDSVSTFTWLLLEIIGSPAAGSTVPITPKAQTLHFRKGWIYRFHGQWAAVLGLSRIQLTSLASVDSWWLILVSAPVDASLYLAAPEKNESTPPSRACKKKLWAGFFSTKITIRSHHLILIWWSMKVSSCWFLIVVQKRMEWVLCNPKEGWRFSTGL